MLESSIDFPQKGLDTTVWTKTDGSPRIKPDVKQTIMSVLGRYPGEDLSKLGKIHIVGSICTNQYTDNADVDIHINPSDPSRFTDENVKQLKHWFDKNRDRINGWIGEHPIEVYLQLDPNQDALSDGVYNLSDDRWDVGPKLTDDDFNPYDNYSDLFDVIRDTVKDADELLGELKRDVIDYDVIKKALKQLSPEGKRKALVTLSIKLDEIESDIESLYKEKDKWTNLRKSASKPASLEQAKNDIELAKKWDDANAIFKFISRYHYFRVINDLKKMIDDDKIDQGEINKIKKVTGVDELKSLITDDKVDPSEVNTIKNVVGVK